MGQPKKFKKKYERPKKPWDKERIESEKKIRENYGLRRKKEIWRAEGIIREFRRRARELQAKKDEKKEKELLERLNKIGIGVKRLDDVLNVTLDDILGRRLQTIIFKKGLANTPKQARQYIVHGHVNIGDRRVTWPSFIVEKGSEEQITLSNYLTAKIIREEAKK
jgi:small subunit ribosomal protein S4